MHKIENDFLRVTIQPRGAELTSVFNKQTNIEHLWNADPAFWNWHAPVLFPVVGRCLNDSITVDGISYPMEKHGFARKTDFEVVETGPSHITFSLATTAQTLAVYPFRFELRISYTLQGASLVCGYRVVNMGEKVLPFSLGAHPAFAVPFKGAGHPEKYEDYYIEFEVAENLFRHYINNEGFFDGRLEQVLNNATLLPLNSQMFANDAYIFKSLKSRSVSIKSKTNPHFLQVSFPHFTYLGLWAKVGAPYVCIEPWLGCADTAGKPTEFINKEGVILLAVGKDFNAAVTVTAG